MLRRSRSGLFFCALLGLVLTGCQMDKDAHQQAASGHPKNGDAKAAKVAGASGHVGQWQSLTQLVAVIHPTAGNQAHGTVRFTQQGDGVKMLADLQGLPPQSTLGFHIHEFGDCSAADASSAGGHYNPQGQPHAGPDADQHHAGDMGNIQSDAAGKAHYELTLHNLSLAGLRNPILGRGVVVHAKADDFKSQPAGDAGSRIGCGVIGIAQTPGK